MLHGLLGQTVRGFSFRVGNRVGQYNAVLLGAIPSARCAVPEGCGQWPAVDGARRSPGPPHFARPPESIPRSGDHGAWILIQEPERCPTSGGGLQPSGDPDGSAGDADFLGEALVAVVFGVCGT